ncbi:MAG TPA: hypothetical protein VIC56_10210 [Gemmatimonadota bacterium]
MNAAPSGDAAAGAPAGAAAGEDASVGVAVDAGAGQDASGGVAVVSAGEELPPCPAPDEEKEKKKRRFKNSVLDRMRAEAAGDTTAVNCVPVEEGDDRAVAAGEDEED